jgi:hypothetical protein
MLAVMALVRDRNFEMIDTDQWRRGEGGRYASSVAIPTSHEISFRGFIAGKFFGLVDRARGTGMGNSSRKSGKPR